MADFEHPSIFAILLIVNFSITLIYTRLFCGFGNFHITSVILSVSFYLPPGKFIGLYRVHDNAALQLLFNISPLCRGTLLNKNRY